jgi:hypothetical protein
VPTLAKVEREAALLKADNIKMFEDNRSLAKLLSHQNERIGYANAQDPERAVLYERSRRELLAATAERDELKAQVAALKALQVQPDVVTYHKLTAELELTKAQLKSALDGAAHIQSFQQPTMPREYPLIMQHTSLTMIAVAMAQRLPQSAPPRVYHGYHLACLRLITFQISAVSTPVSRYMLIATICLLSHNQPSPVATKLLITPTHATVRDFRVVISSQTDS